MRWKIVVAVLVLAGCAFSQTGIQTPECGGAIHGMISDVTGHPAKSLRVQLFPIGVDLGVVLPNLRTNDRGEYSFVHVCPGMFSVLPVDEQAGYPIFSYYLYQFLYGHTPETVTLDSSTTSAQLNVVLPPKPAFLRVRVVDGKTKSEIHNYKLSINVQKQPRAGSLKMQRTAHMAEDSIPIPPNKMVTLRVSVRGHKPWVERRQELPESVKDWIVELNTSGAI